MYSKKYLIIFFIFICLWCFGIISPAVFHDQNAFFLAKPFLSQVYSTVCHQQYEKTISIVGENIFVCSRCAGIYLGLFIVGLSSLIFTKKIKWSFYLVLISAIIMVIDVSFT